MDFTKILKNTLKLEGGYTVDNGGATNRGIRQKYYDVYTKEKKLPQKNVKELTWGDVKGFYEDQYWNKPKFSRINSEKIAGVLFDYGVNAGQGKAVQELQKIVGTKADGIIGKKTINALNKYVEKNGEDFLAGELIRSRGRHYQELVMQDPMTYQPYLQGWINRLDSLKQIYGVQ